MKVRSSTRLWFVVLLSVACLQSPPSAQAGCGCDKAPPAPAAVRPHATYAGMDVTIFDASLQSEQTYEVTFTSGITGESQTVSGVAVTKRDLADSQYKPQVVVAVPFLPLGPTSISVSQAGQSGALLATDDAALTVVPQPLALTNEVGTSQVPDFQAAVSREGTVYLSLDLTGLTLPRTFKGTALGYPLRFSGLDVIFYNAQGFVMQLLEEGMTGLYSINTAAGTNSDTLMYSRHEFNTYFVGHTERQTHEVDTTDPNWHLDGTPHIDHDHMIVAIAGQFDDGSLPAPGATPPFDLAVEVRSFFHHGLFGDAYVDMTDNARIDAYNLPDGGNGPAGNILSNGLVALSVNATVDGHAKGFRFDISGNAHVTGETTVATEPTEFIPVDIPAGLEDLGTIFLTSRRDSLTLVGPASYRVANLVVLDKGQLHIDNTAGPVTAYVTGRVDILANNVTAADPDPEKFAVYVAGDGPVRLNNNGTFHGVVYAPEAFVSAAGQGDFYGAFVGGEVMLLEHARVHYDLTLKNGKPSNGNGGKGGGGKKK